jgi:hypothetical protein
MVRPNLLATTMMLSMATSIVIFSMGSLLHEALSLWGDH